MLLFLSDNKPLGRDFLGFAYISAQRPSLSLILRFWTSYGSNKRSSDQNNLKIPN
ncbi:hypothetical protein Csa_002229 [Cucumis sativus]|uniref:Uncharacterized protein n=1 Tax=Cucumis sativus TaxID=3659 RepID=A0A0A0LI18_CUCSA|nr:hypothetical protein Csa_002229 [Cucumis sativus]